MSRRLAILSTLAAALTASPLFAVPAAAGNVAWSVAIGGPGFAVSAGAPGYWGARPAYGPVYRPGHRHALYQPYYRAYAPAPIFFAAPVAYPAPVVVAPAVHGPRRIVVPAPYLPPRAVPYGRY
jgi:hypothetical protein